MTSPPIIVIGMHRSGTGMLARVLSGLGVWMGERQSDNSEDMFFFTLNEWLLRLSGAAWTSGSMSPTSPTSRSKQTPTTSSR